MDFGTEHCSLLVSVNARVSHEPNILPLWCFGIKLLKHFVKENQRIKKRPPKNKKRFVVLKK